ncbi:MAG: hypothetical protein GXO89_01580, partial [Chlorobi bacterium]|nr:hypothetical protein [Chlorobiota bacterium]
LTPTDLKVNALIKNFKQKVAYYRKNPTLKSGESLPADSALWYLEATINYSHAFPNEYYNQFEVDTSYLAVPLNGDGTVDMAVLTQKYDEMKAKVADDYHNSSFTEKGLGYVSLTEISQNNGEMSLIVESGTGKKSNEPPPTPVNGPFGPGDDWYYGEDAGNCGTNAPMSSDAAEQLYIEASNTIPDPNGNYTFIGPFIEKEIFGGDADLQYPNDPVPGDNHLDYYLFYADTEIGISEDTLCLEYTEMNTYWNRLKYLMYHYYLDQPGMEDYDIMCILVFDDYSDLYGPNNSYVKYYHKGTLKFGKKIYIADGNLPEEL